MANKKINLFEHRGEMLKQTIKVVYGQDSNPRLEVIYEHVDVLRECLAREQGDIFEALQSLVTDSDSHRHL